MKSKTSIWLLIGLLTGVSASANQFVLDDQIVSGTSDGSVPAYDCTAPTLPFFPGPPSSGFVPLGDPVLAPPTPIISSCDLTGDPIQCEYTCGEQVGHVCVGLDCVNGEAFGDAELVLKENNTRIRFVDSTVADELAQNWNLEANSSANGGLHYLAFQLKSADDEELLFSDGMAPSYDCVAPTLPFLSGQFIDPASSNGTIPFGEPLLEPVPADSLACQISWFNAGQGSDPVECAFTCPQKLGYTERNVFRLGSGGSDSSFNNGVAIGANSVPEDGKVTIGQAGLLRALKHLAIGLADTDASNYGSMLLKLAALNSQLDVLETRIIVLEGGAVILDPNDVNGDGTVSFADVMALLPCYGRAVASNPQCEAADVNDDGVVNFLDISQVRSNIIP